MKIQQPVTRTAKVLAPGLFLAALTVCFIFPEWGKDMGGLLVLLLGQVALAFSPRVRQWMRRWSELQAVNEVYLEQDGATLHLRRVTRGKEFDRKSFRPSELERVVEWVGFEDHFWEFTWKNGTRWTAPSVLLGDNLTNAIHAACLEDGIPPIPIERRALVLRPAESAQPSLAV